MARQPVYDEEAQTHRSAACRVVGIAPRLRPPAPEKSRPRSTNQPKFIVNESGELFVVPGEVGGKEIAHTVASGGAKVQAAGEVVFSPPKTVSLTPYSGHYKPPIVSESIGIDAFKKAGFTVHGG
ncbi:MAG: hypothetical protein C0467_18665 [Planctomycetaceae bacterium]|nr:hypothetical protein [Planctomycetaceae bacterium]